ncbi:MAG: hypothetical protein P0S96_06240 [Simkaniaceae bacterium]|nr:hypothetical protein [Candidatus Sacchlamyda saccharinae]
MGKSMQPISKENFIPTLPEMPQREYNWMGRIIYWVRDSKEHGIIHHTVVTTLAVFTSFALIFSVVLSPLFIYGYKEYIRQCERAVYDRKFKEVLQIATQHGTQSFQKGREDPIKTANISLGWTNRTRNRIIKDLDLSREAARELSDKELLILAAKVYHNVFERYGLKIR